MPEGRRERAPLPPCMCSLGRGYALDVDNGGQTMSIHVPYVLLLSERDPLGCGRTSWAHAARPVRGRSGRPLADRYTDPNAPRTVDGGVLGPDGHWLVLGNPGGERPHAHVLLYQGASGWLRYRQAEVGQEYTLAALESQTAGDECSS